MSGQTPLLLVPLDRNRLQLESELRNAYERIATQDAAIRHLTMRLKTLEAQLAAYQRAEEVRAKFDAESA